MKYIFGFKNNLTFNLNNNDLLDYKLLISEVEESFKFIASATIQYENKKFDIIKKEIEITKLNMINQYEVDILSIFRGHFIYSEFNGIAVSANLIIKFPDDKGYNKRILKFER